jgi:hypothetical protein
VTTPSDHAAENAPRKGASRGLCVPCLVAAIAVALALLSAAGYVLWWIVDLVRSVPFL